MAGDDLGDFSMIELFRVEVEGQAATLADGLLALEHDHGAPETLESLMRAAHSIKGAARLVDMPPAVNLAHAMEDCFVAAQQGNIVFSDDDIDVLLRGVDLLKQIADANHDSVVAANPESEQQELDFLIDQLQAIRNGERPTRQDTTHAAGADPATPSTAAAVDANMLALFRIEADTYTTSLSEGLLRLETGDSNAEELDTLVQAAHSIKSAARLVNMEAAIGIAQAMEECFVAARQQRIDLCENDIDALIRSVDLLRQIAHLDPDECGPWNAQHGAEIDRLTALLGTLLTGEHAPAVAAPAATPTDTAATRSDPTLRTAGEAPSKERVLRVNADRVNRLIGLAGEFRVSSGWLRTYANSMLNLKRRQTDLIGSIERLRLALEEAGASELAHTLLADAQTRADECRQSLASRLTELEDFDRRANNLAGRLNHEVIASRMRPFGDGVQGFRRMVRDVARSLGKKVELQIYGLDTQVDRDILEKIEAPMNHILRNAVDHGIETPAERRELGKAEVGTIAIEAIHSAGMLSISVSDDGRGVDLEKLRRRIVERNMVNNAMADALSESELLDFLFLPAFSTRDQVTEISGRGVGLDVVHSVVQEMRGQIRSSTTPGMGLRIHLQLPLTLSVVRSLLVEIGGELYAFPLARIENIVKLERTTIQTIEDRQYFPYAEKNIGLVDAAQVLGLERAGTQDSQLSVVIIGDRNRSFGVVVDTFIGERDLAVHALDPRLGKLQDVSAAAITEDGDPLLILDVDDMLRSIEKLVSGKRLQKVRRGDDGGERSVKRVLVVDDSLTVREVERKLLESRGYAVDVAVDGMDGWNTVRVGEYDLVISDIDMPRMNGIEFVTLIRRDPTLKSMPIMIVSYKDRPEDRDLGLQAGADYYLAKGSFHDETLVDAVSDLIGEATS